MPLKIEDIGRRFLVIINDTLETAHPFQSISVAIQHGNAVSFISTFGNERKAFQPY